MQFYSGKYGVSNSDPGVIQFVFQNDGLYALFLSESSRFPGLTPLKKKRRKVDESAEVADDNSH